MWYFFTDVVYVWLKCQFTVKRTVPNLFVFYHDACFHARATNKMILIWVNFHLVVINTFEECFWSILDFPIVPMQGQSKKNIWISHYNKLRQIPKNNLQKTQKLTSLYAQFFRILWQSVTKYIQTRSKSVNIFKTFERIKYISILVFPPYNWRVTSYLEYQELSTQMQSYLHTTLKLGGGGLVSEFLWLIAKIC